MAVKPLGNQKPEIYDADLVAADTVPTNGNGSVELQTQQADTQRPPRIRRALGWAAAAGVISGAASLFVVPTDIKVGPHNAEMTLSLEPQVDIDTGLPGTLRLPIAKWGLGADLEVKEVPSEYGDALEGDFSESDAQGYVAFFDDPEGDTGDAFLKLARTAAQTGSWGFAGTLFAYAGIYDLLGSRRRRELTTGLKRLDPEGKLRRNVLAGGLAGMSALAVHHAVFAKPNLGKSNISSAFNDTPLEGGVIDGKVLQFAVNDFGEEAIGLYKENQQFYSDLADNLETATAEAPNLLVPTDTTSTILVEGPLHCNIGMAKPLERAVELLDPTLIISTGDDVFGGTPLDEVCTRVFADYKQNKERIIALGNHRSDSTEELAEDHGDTVLDGKVIEVQGLRILGDTEPTISEFGSERTQTGEETTAGLGYRLAETAAMDEKGVDVVVTNQPTGVAEAATRGDVKLALSGGLAGESTFEIVTSDNGRQVIKYTAASSGGAASENLTLGPLRSDAEVTLFELDKETGEPLRYQIIRFGEDGTVGIDEPVDLPFASIRDQLIAYSAPPGLPPLVFKKADLNPL